MPPTFTKPSVINRNDKNGLRNEAKAVRFLTVTCLQNNCKYGTTLQKVSFDQKIRNLFETWENNTVAFKTIYFSLDSPSVVSNYLFLFTHRINVSGHTEA